MKNQAEVFEFPKVDLDVRVYVGPECHAGAATATLVDFETNHVVVECADCGEEIVRFNMAKENEDS